MMVMRMLLRLALRGRSGAELTSRWLRLRTVARYPPTTVTYLILRRKYCVVIALTVLLACTRRPVSISVEVPPDYRGGVTVELCVSGKPGVAHIDQRGQGQTSVCVGKGEGVSVFYVQGDTRTEIAEERVRVETTGDGVPRLVTFSR
jgi:hypothetical protein